jgi:NRAMP (natural resistance-associated macrophage protein)-like metal ion transporter
MKRPRILPVQTFVRRMLTRARGPAGTRGRWRRIGMFLAVLGPGMITANVDNDAGGIATYSLAGAHFGLSLLWTIIPMTVALIATQEVCARMGVVTGKGLSDLIREQYGVKTTVWVMLALVITNFGNTMAEFAGIAAASEIFGIPRQIAVPAAALFVWALVVRGTNRIVERIFLAACLIYIAYPISGFLAAPPWREVAVAMVWPPLRFDRDYLQMTVGLVGTTIAPWMQFYQQSAVVDKGLRAADVQYERWDTIIGCLITDIVALFIVVACAATLYVHHIRIEDASDAARALVPLAGTYAGGLFALGLLNASLFAASVLPLSTAFVVCEALGWESGVSQRFSSAPQFFGLYTTLIFLGAAAVLIPHFPLVTVMFLSQVVNGMVLPLVLFYIVRLAARHDLMGTFVNTRAVNGVLWATTVIMTALTILSLLSQFGLW